MKNILIISPAYPSAINGLGDYSVMLGKSLKNTHLSIFYAGLPQKETVQLSPYAVINQEQSIFKLVEKNKIDLIFINYSNYGYQKKGIPFWLLAELKKTKNKGLLILTFFHEVYASGKPWQSVFWLKPLQRKIFRQLYLISDFNFCSNDRVLKIIKDETYDKGLKAKNIGIFSNIPEITIDKPWINRKNNAIVFGSLGRRNAVYKNVTALRNLMKSLDLKGIIDIGPGDTIEILENLQLPYEIKNELPATEISIIFKNNKWAIIDYHDSLLGKSGIFAAYASHGLVTINLSIDHENENDFLVKGEDYLVYNDLERDYEQVSLNIFEWYRSRNLKNHTDKIIEIIDSFN
ncbi:hypothetical protein I5M32_03755 [Pedobacter sp. SD-b]|uniref:Uncharacterized protein n=1 Tax=Pedobacter segetis TaxID=2793069 RepID=A0ABS1BGT2_9SPHI|nr:hypothetical protein [Pedobacter segetis]MBK0382065.1 hypothetical protein [Pedobacter segetis]